MGDRLLFLMNDGKLTSDETHRDFWDFDWFVEIKRARKAWNPSLISFARKKHTSGCTCGDLPDRDAHGKSEYLKVWFQLKSAPISPSSPNATWSEENAKTRKREKSIEPTQSKPDQSLALLFQPLSSIWRSIWRSTSSSSIQTTRILLVERWSRSLGSRKIRNTSYSFGSSNDSNNYNSYNNSSTISSSSNNNNNNMIRRTAVLNSLPYDAIFVESRCPRRSSSWRATV
eukprot:jgi/Psemu1/2452/gm1.2452_g